MVCAGSGERIKMCQTEMDRGFVHPHIGVDLAGILGGRVASADGGLMPSGVKYGAGCPFHSRLEGLRVRRELSKRG